MKPQSFAERLLDWFDRHGRKHLPWQHPRTPYRVWLAEIMLQQTQVTVAAPYFERFTAALPTLPALAGVTPDQVLALWSGLGYYTRARNLHRTARICMNEHGGELPRDFAALMALPGIGRSTAGAIAAQAWGERRAIVDGNVRRVLARHHGIDGWPGQVHTARHLWNLAETLLPATRLADYTQAQMDLGALVCTRHSPACHACPVAADCVARVHNRVRELPTPKPAKSLPERERSAWLLLDPESRVLLQRRPPVGVWADLWSLPETDDAAQADVWLRRHTRSRAQILPLPPIRHTFSHYRLLLHLRQRRAVILAPAIGDDDTLRWIARRELANCGIPAPIRSLLETVLPFPLCLNDPT